MSRRDFDYTKTPFPWFGGKRDAAPAIWAALGDVPHYVEPFAGGMAVLLNRPHEVNRTYHSETINDIDGLLVNAIRCLQLCPSETAKYASWPVVEVDLTARHLAIVRWQAERDIERLLGDPEWCDPKIGGWWIWGLCCWIGSGWCAGDGPWTTGADGRIYKQPPVKRGREPGVSSQRPHLTDNGNGVNAPQLREPGVASQLPVLNNDGNGVNAPQLREPGVWSQRPHLHDDGRGVNHAGLREPGIFDESYEHAYHPWVMPRLEEWFAFLSARLRHVRICSGDWKRVLTNSASKTLSVTKSGGVCGVFLDPPYADTAKRSDGLYTKDSLTVAHDVREWCLANGDDPQYRIVLAGFDGEHGTALVDAGWREIEWFKTGHLKGGYGVQGKDGHQQHRERLWASPHCLQPSTHGLNGHANGHAPALATANGPLRNQVGFTFPDDDTE